MNVRVGNAGDADTKGTGWFIGFSEWARAADSDLLYVAQQQPVSGLCVKWFDHPAGHDSGSAKPVSEGRTVSILVSVGSRFRIEFCETADFPVAAVQSVTLQRHGDYAAWGAGLFHRWHCESRSTVLTLRWNDR
ncbi:MAG TPA: hypothetical protein VHM00_18400 [Caldimonas sp.]|jgi:hypothetical protein|nr:hypothetical protein [Caldimonas sp.]HEX2543039.1 hypothetical protein [Caldimonas sp.]